MRKPRFRRILSYTVWSPDAKPEEERRYLSLRRFWYPFADLVFIGAGLSAMVYGIPAINAFFPEGFVDAFGIGLIVVGFVCLVGVCVPRLWLVEVIGKSLLVGMMSSYVSALLILTHAGDDARGFIAAVAGLAIVVPAMRLTVLSSEWRTRRLEALASSQLEVSLVEHREGSSHGSDS